jgi:cell division GTPase FtsZ
MDENPDILASPTSPATRNAPLVVKVFGVGNAGLNVLDQLTAGGLPAAACVAINADAHSLAACSAGAKIQLETSRLRGSRARERFGGRTLGEA